MQKELKEIKKLLEHQGQVFSRGYSEFHKNFVTKEELKVIDGHFKNIGLGVDRVEKHLEKLNGQVGKNTAFRNKAFGGFIILGFLGIGQIITAFLLKFYG